MNLPCNSKQSLRKSMMASVCIIGLVFGAGANTLAEVMEIMEGVNHSAAAWPPAEKDGPETDPADKTALKESAVVLNTETTLIGTPRLPDTIITELDVTSGVSLGSVLRSLAKLADVNMVFSEEVNERNSFSFKMQQPTPWNELFESVLKVHHLTYLHDSNMIRIMTVDDMAKEYELQEAVSRRTALDAETRSIEAKVLAVIDVKYAKAEALVVILKELLEQSSISGGGIDGGRAAGSVSADPANNSVIINAIQSDVDKLINLVKRMDKPTRQVRIEANIVEVSSSLVRELGMKWQAEVKFKDYGETGPDVERTVPTEYGELDDTFGKMGVALDPLAGMIEYGILTEDFNLAATLTALQEDGKVKILSRPSITTMDNQKATIKSGSDVPFSTTNQDGDPVVQWQEAVLLLDVTPHLIDESEMTLDIVLLNDEVDFSQTVDGNPLIQKKEARSSLVLRDGETTVIAGLTKNNLEQGESGIPLLKDIPLLGYFFKYKRKSDKRQELVIFITPRVVDERLSDQSEFVNNWIDTTYNQ